MPTYLYYTQGILDFQEETASYSEERLEIRLKRNVLAIVLIWAMEIQGVTMRNLLYAFIAWELTLFVPLDTHDPVTREKGFDAPVVMGPKLSDSI